MPNRIGLITFFQSNYGSELQCYATKSFLKSHGFECDVLFEQEFGWEKIKKKTADISKLLFYSVAYPGFWKNRKQIKMSNRFNSGSQIDDSKFALRWFSESVLQPKGVEYRLLKEKRFRDQYHSFVAGSDQIWGGGYLVPPIMFLEFAEDDKKIALCPSFGTGSIKKFNRRHFKKAISSFSHLSVREESGFKIIQELTGKNATRIPDPIMLLSSSEWSDFSERGIKMESAFIFAHFLGKPCDRAIDFLNYLSDSHNIPIICFANDYKEYDRLHNYSLVGGSPFDYVSLIKEASFVCTDSFHTTHFSIVFNKRFFTFNRNYGHSNSQNTRIENLLSIYKCEDRLITDNVEKFDQISLYAPNFDSIRNTETERICKYLLDAVGSNMQRSAKLGIKPISECSGCMACVAICPKSAISISYSDFGYRIPKVDSTKCIDCKLCTHVCQADIPHKMFDEVNAYIAYSKDQGLKQRSASGGVFSTIAKSFLENGGIIAAARLSFEDGLPIVNHVLIDNISDLDTVLGSKYVESNCESIYCPIAENLKLGKRVLFCGTSCQVKALLSFLKCKRITDDNLFTIDLVCHGVPGMQLFSDYLAVINEKKCGKFTDLHFRVKKGGSIIYQLEGVQNVSNKKCSLSISIMESSYYDMFMSQENYREQCYHCEFASSDKPADITIGDYFEAKRDYPNLFTQGAILSDADYINCMIVRSPKGRQLINQFGNELFVHPIDLKRVQLSHSNLCKPSNYTRIRFDALYAYKEKGYHGVEKIYKAMIRKKKLLNSIKRLISR